MAIPLTTLLGRHWLGLEIPDDQLMPTNRPWAFALYTVASFLYRWMIMFSIIWFLMVWLEPYGLESVGKGIAIFAIFGMLLWPSYKLYRYMSVPGRMHQIEKPRFFIGLAILVVIVSALLMVPIPHSLRSSLIMVPQQIETVYVLEQGVVKEFRFQDGEAVRQGDVLAVLENLDLEIAYENALGKLAEKQEDRRALLLEGAVASDPDRLETLSRLDTEIRQLMRMKSDLEKRRERLTIRAPIAGTVLATPYQHPAEVSEELPLVDPQPLVGGRNENVYVIRGQRFCEVADLSRWHAIVLLDEQQVKFARTGMKARIKLYSQADRVIESEVTVVGVSDQSLLRDKRNQYDPMEAPKSRLPDLVTEMVAAYQQTEIQYFALVPIDPDQAHVKIGLGGQARLDTGYRSLGARLWWWISHNFLS